MLVVVVAVAVAVFVRALLVLLPLLFLLFLLLSGRLASLPFLPVAVAASRLFSLPSAVELEGFPEDDIPGTYDLGTDEGRLTTVQLAQQYNTLMTTCVTCECCMYAVAFLLCLLLLLVVVVLLLPCFGVVRPHACGLVCVR